MIFKTWLSDINKVALAVEGLKDIQIAGTVNNLNSTSLNAFVKGVEGLTLSQANAALSTKALTEAQKEQILISAGLLKSSKAITLEEVKQMASSMSLSAQKKEEILTTLQGAYVENEWNKEKLESIVASGGEAGAIAKSILAKKAENSENVKELAGRKALTVVLWDELKARLALIATNPATWVTLAIGAIAGITIAYQKATLTIKEATDALENSKSSYNSVSDEVSKLTEELNECQSRMQELENMGSLRSIVEDDELEKLQNTNVELTRRLAILKEEQRLKAVDVAKDASNVMTTNVESQYNTITIGGSDERGQLVKPEEEMRLAIDAYRKYAEEKAKIDAELLKDPDNTELAEESQKWQDKMDLAASRANEMARYINQTEEAYKKVIDTGGTLTNTQTELYNSSIALGNEYLNFAKEIGTVSESFENLDTTEKAQTLKDKYAKKTISLPNGQGSYTVDDKEISDWIDTLSDEDLKILGTINFSGEQTKDSMQEALDYAKTHTEITSDDNPVSLNISSTIDQLNTKLKPAIDSLASAWQDIFTDDGFTKDNIDIAMFDSIKSKLDELNKIDGISVDYSSFDDFVNVLNDTESSSVEIQDAFDNLSYSIANTAVSGIENFSLLKETLKDLGFVDYEILAFDSLINNTDALKSAGLDLVEVSKMESDEANNKIAAFAEEMVSAENLSQAIAMLTYQKELCSLQDMNTSGEIANLKNLAENAGYTGEVIEYLTELETLYQEVANGMYDPHTIQDKLDRAEELKNLIETSANKITLTPNEKAIDWKPLVNSAKKAGKDAGKSAAEEYKDALEKGLSNLDKVIGYINNIIGKQIDLFNDQKDAAIDALEAEKKAAEEALQAEKDRVQAQIDAKQEEIDKIKEAREQRQAEIDLQKKQYDLARLQNQNSILQYSEKKGMHYVTDTQGIRDARESVDEAKENLKILAIEKEITNLEDVIKSLDKQIENSNDYFDSLISQTEAYWDSLIKNLENYKSRWDELAELQEQAEMIAMLEKMGISTEDILNMSESAFQDFKTTYLALLGEMNKGNDDMISSLSEIAGVDMSVLTNGLSETQKAMLDISNTSLSSLAEDFDNVGNSVNNVSNAIGGSGGSASSSGNNASNGESNNQGENVSTGSLKQAIEDQTEDAKEKIGEQAELFSSEDGLKGAIQQVIDTLGIADADGNVEPDTLMGAVMAQYEKASEVLPEEKSLFDNLASAISACVAQLQTMVELLDKVEAGGTSVHGGGGHARAKGTVGNAYASGTGNYKGLPKDEKNTLRSEYGQPELTVYPNGTYELTTEPTISDLPKDTVIFNDEQTKKILNNNKGIIGKTYSNGTNPDGTIVLKNSSVLRPLQPGDSSYELMKKFESYQDKLVSRIIPPVSAIDRNLDMISKTISNVNNNRNSMQQVIHQNINLTCPNVTNNSGVEYIQKELGHLSQRAMQEAYKR